MRCSVVIGMRREPGIASNDPRLREELPSATDPTLGENESFDGVSWKQIRSIAHSLRYPLYRHTSCAIALVESRPEQLGTWRPDIAQERCAPCECPLSQRALCMGRRDAVNDPVQAQAFTRAVAKFLDLDQEQVTCEASNRRIHIYADINELDYNIVLHSAQGRYKISVSSIDIQKAWPGTFAARSSRERDD